MTTPGRSCASCAWWRPTSTDQTRAPCAHETRETPRGDWPQVRETVGARCVTWTLRGDLREEVEA